MSTPQARNGIESATAGMTLDEMLTKYPKRQVEQAVTQRKYKEYGKFLPYYMNV